MTFDVSLSSPFDRWGGIEAMERAAVLADTLGFYSVQFGEHIVTPTGDDATPSGAIWYDNFVLAAHLAAKTKRLRFIFNAMIPSFRPAIQAAKLIATLDVVTQGRVIVGVAVGWQKEEFDTLGVSFEERGAITEEYIRAMKVLWTEDRPVFSGRYVSFRDIAFLPKCFQKPHAPLWIGGSGPRAMRRTVELGDGWSPNSGTIPELTDRIKWIKEQAKLAGRDPEKLAFAYSVGIGDLPKPSEFRAAGGRYFSTEPTKTPEQVIDFIRRYKDAGVNHISLRFDWDSPAQFMSKMEWFAKHVMPAFKPLSENTAVGGHR